MKSVFIKDQNVELAVGTVYCIGKNYAKHAAELGSVPEEEPVVFLKPTGAIIREPEKIQLPAFSQNVHHEVELVVLIGKDGKNITQDEAPGHILAYGVGLDLTARDVQDTLKKKGLPWTISKGFDTSACLSDFVEASVVGDPRRITFSLAVNGAERQQGQSAMMLFPVPVLISYLSSIFTLHRGDIIFTGTPEGVSRILSGDVLNISLMDLVSARFEVT